MDTKVLYRPGYTSPGESLLVARNPVDMLFREKMWAQSTNMVYGRDFIMPPVSAYPLPVYPVVWPKGRKRWLNLPPEAMWHPLMWLPPILATRLPVHFVDRFGKLVETEECADSWAVRVLVELTATGFYDIETGGWLDVLALHGLDIQDRNDLDRVDKWLNGAEDAVLDTIDLTEYFTYPHNPPWSADYMSEALNIVQKATASNLSYGTLEWLIPIRNSGDEEAMLDGLVVACALAAEKIGPANLVANRERWVNTLAKTMRLSPDDEPTKEPALEVMAPLLDVAETGEPYLERLRAGV